MCISAVLATNRSFFFFFNDTATTEIYTLSLHDALPILTPGSPLSLIQASETVDEARLLSVWFDEQWASLATDRSEEHTSELQSRLHLVCRLLLEKKKLRPPLSAL